MTAVEGTSPKPFGWRYTLPLFLGSTLNPINSSMIATGLAAIASEYALGPGQAALLVSVLYICSAIMQPTMGKLAGLFGPRRVFLAGIAILFIGGVLGAASVQFWMLVVSRVLIGAGTSAAYPTAMALVRRRADALGLGVPSTILGGFSIAAQVTIVVGLPLGGLLTGWLGWRGLFLVNVPVAIFTFVMAWIGIDRDPPLALGGARTVLAALDLPGIALFAATTGSLLLLLSDLTNPLWWLIPVVVVLLAAFILWERRVSNPMVDVRMLAANGPLQRTYIRQFLVGLAVYTGLYGVSQWMEEGAGLSATATGLILIPLSGASIILARLNSSKGWVRWPLILGGIAVILTGVAMAFIGATDAALIWELIGMSILFGLPNGFSGFPNQATLYVQSPANEIAVASGLSRTASYLGAIFSSSVISLAFGPHIDDAGFHRLAWVVVGIGVLSTLMAVADRKIPVVAKGNRVKD